MNIKFTSEIEIDNSLYFLDIQIVRTDGQFVTSVYHKPTFGGGFTNYESFIPKSFKFALIFNLLRRAFKIMLKLQGFLPRSK